MSKDRGSANFIFGMGFGLTTDEDHDPATVGENWKSGNTMMALPPSSVWSNFQAYVVGTYNQYGQLGNELSGVWQHVGEYSGLGEGDSGIPNWINVVPPYYAADGTSLYFRDETLWKMGIGSHEIPPHLMKDVMDSDAYLEPNELVRYPMEGWQPIGQWDMDGGPVA